MEWTLKRVVAALLFLASGLNVYFWEFVRARIYDKVWAMIEPFLPSADLMARAGVTLALFAAGAGLLWQTRPAQQAAIEPVANRTRRAKPDGRMWLSGTQIFQLADPQLLQSAGEFEAKVRANHEQLRKMADERQNLTRSRTPYQAMKDLTSAAPLLEEYERQTSDAYLEKAAIEQELITVRVKILENLYEQLSGGKLIAKGFRYPVGNNPQEVEIPSAEWRIIRLSRDSAEAEGQGIKYVGIAVARA